MKKKYICLLLAISTPAFVFAWPCEHLKIVVKNDTPSTCYLIQRTIHSGLIDIRGPYKIVSGSKITQFELIEQNYNPVYTSLTYECGENHTVSFSSYKERCHSQHEGKIEGMLIKENSLNAVFFTKESNYFTQTPSTIFWTIS